MNVMMKVWKHNEKIVSKNKFPLKMAAVIRIKRRRDAPSESFIDLDLLFWKMKAVNEKLSKAINRRRPFVLGAFVHPLFPLLSFFESGPLFTVF